MSELNITKLNPELTPDYILKDDANKDVTLELDTFAFGDIKRNKDLKNKDFVRNEDYQAVSGFLYQDIETLLHNSADLLKETDRLN